MAVNPFAAFPARPDDVAGWEELLVRLELAPRVLRNTLEELDDSPTAVRQAVLPSLVGLVARELAATESLRALREGEGWPAGTGPEAIPGGRVAREWLVHFAELRARNFAAVQRRGLDVWDWAAPHPEHGTVTAFQLLSRLAQEDGRTLAEIRHLLHATSRC
jgi:hypothetical protein